MNPKEFRLAKLANGQALPLQKIPELSPEDFSEAVVQIYDHEKQRARTS